MQLSYANFAVALALHAPDLSAAALIGVQHDEDRGAHSCILRLQLVRAADPLPVNSLIMGCKMECATQAEAEDGAALDMWRCVASCPLFVECAMHGCAVCALRRRLNTPDDDGSPPVISMSGAQFHAFLQEQAELHGSN